MIVEGDNPAMVLMLTAADSPGDHVAGLGLGADDYLAKPFHFPELVLRIRTLARRQPHARDGSSAPWDRARSAPPRRDPRRPPARPLRQGVRCWSRCCDQKARRQRRGPPRTGLDEHANPFTNTVLVTISRLRRKLGDPPAIETVPGVGYRIAGRAGDD